MSDNATSRRVEGPTPAGGAYAIGFFLHNGRPVPQRFANQMVLVEYDAAGNELARTLGTTTPQALLPPDFVSEGGDVTPLADSLLQMASSLGGMRLSPRERAISDGPPVTTQAVSIARAHVAGAPRQADYALALHRSAELLEGRGDLNGRWVSARWKWGPRGYIQILPGWGRAVEQLPDGVAADDVIELDLGDITPSTDRLRAVRDALDEALADGNDDEASTSRRLVENALRSAEAGGELWHELLERAHRSVNHVDGQPAVSVSAEQARESFSGLRRQAETARSAFALDLLITAGAHVLESVALAVANRGVDDLRRLYHHFNLALANGPATDEPALHMVAAAITNLAIDEGFTEEIAALAARELALADDVIERALDLPDDLDGFYSLLFDAALPLQAAEIFYRVLASTQSQTGSFAPLAKAAEERRMRAVASITWDTMNLYAPLLARARERVQDRIRSDGLLAGRIEALDLIGHTLTLPRWLEPFLLTEDLDGDEFWSRLMQNRRPFRTPFAPWKRGDVRK